MTNKLGFSGKLRPMLKSESDVLLFGQHKGQTVEWILDNDPNYIVWLSDKKVCDVHYEIYDKAVSMNWEEDDDWIPDKYNFQGDN